MGIDKESFSTMGKKGKTMTPQMKAEFLTYATRIIPTISEIIDEKGGLAQFSELGNEPRVRGAMTTIPEHLPKTVKNVIECFPDFITCFEDGRCATAKAYEA